VFSFSAFNTQRGVVSWNLVNLARLRFYTFNFHRRGAAGFPSTSVILTVDSTGDGAAAAVID